MKGIATLLTLISCTISLGSAFAAGDCFKIPPGQCVAFPKGGNYLGKDPSGSEYFWSVRPGETVCMTGVSEKVAVFSSGDLNGPKWPTASWRITPDSVCFTQN